MSSNWQTMSTAAMVAVFVHFLPVSTGSPTAENESERAVTRSGIVTSVVWSPRVNGALVPGCVMIVRHRGSSPGNDALVVAAEPEGQIEFSLLRAGDDVTYSAVFLQEETPRLPDLFVKGRVLRGERIGDNGERKVIEKDGGAK